MNNYLKHLFIPLSIILCSCGTDNGNEDEPQIPSQSSNMAYYVKYEASVNSGYIGNIEYSVKTDDGVKTFTSSNKSFSLTVGPVKKGFNATCKVNASSLHQADCIVWIYVCRGNEPFAFKTNNFGGKTVSTSYTIDY